MLQDNDLDYANLHTKSESDYDETKTFDEYFAEYKNYDNGGKLDKMIITDAKKVFETLKTPEAIQTFYDASYEEQQKMVSGLADGHSGASFYCVCQNAYKYADYIKLAAKEKESANKSSEHLTNTKAEQSTASRLATVRKKLASKIDENLGTNISAIKLPKKIKNIEAKISKHFDKSGR